MKSILTSGITIVINVALYFFLLVLLQFSHFFLFGESDSSYRYIGWEALFYVLLQLCALYMLYRKKYFIKNGIFLFLNMLIVVGMHFYFKY
jgi:hypothetical protein